MSNQHIKKFLTDYHIKLWACGLGILLAMSLAATTPPLTNNSISQNFGRPAKVQAADIDAGIRTGIGLASSSQAQTSQPSWYNVQGSSDSAAAASVAAQPTPASVGSNPSPTPYSGYKCTMIEGAQLEGSSSCNLRCSNSPNYCGCGGRGTETMCYAP